MKSRPTPRRDPWRVAWRITTGDAFLVGVTLALAVLLALLAFVPQAPSDAASIERWLVEASAWFGAGTDTLYRLGLFTLTDSALLHVVLALLAFVLVVRAVEQAEEWWHRRQGSDKRPRGDKAMALLAQLGALVLLAGLLMGQVWGWRASGLIEQEGAPLNVPGHGQVTLVSGGTRLHSDRPGVNAYVTGSGPQLIVRALDEAGEPLELQRRPGDPNVAELTLPITPETSEVYFAVPEASLVVRGTEVRANTSAEEPILLQIFRAQTGEMAEEIEFTAETMTLPIDQVQLQLTRSSYRILAVAYDPGRWVKAAGIVLGAVALLGLLVRSPSPSGRWRRAAWVVRPALALLTLVTAGLALRNLVSTGTLWDQSPLQAGASALWAVLLAVGLPRRPAEPQEKGEQG